MMAAVAALQQRYGRSGGRALGWGSRNAEDLFKIATKLAGFDAKELMLEIHRLSKGRRSEKVNMATVDHAMGNITKRHRTPGEQEAREQRVLEFLARGTR